MLVRHFHGTLSLLNCLLTFDFSPFRKVQLGNLSSAADSAALDNLTTKIAASTRAPELRSTWE